VLVSGVTMQMALKSGLYDFVKHTAVIDDNETFVVTRRTDRDQHTGRRSARSARGMMAGQTGTQLLNVRSDRAKVMKYFGIGKAQSRLTSAVSTNRSQYSQMTSARQGAYAVDGGGSEMTRTETRTEGRGDEHMAIAVPEDGEAVSYDDEAVQSPVANSTPQGGDDDEDVDVDADRIARVGSCCNQKFANPDVEEEFYDFDTINKKERRQVTSLRAGVVGFACLLCLLIVVPGDKKGAAAGAMIVFGITGILGVALFMLNRNAETSRLRARLAYAAACGLAFLPMVGTALTTDMYTMVNFAMFVNFMTGLLISPPADWPLAAHMAFATFCAVFTVVTHQAHLTFAIVIGGLWLIFVLVWYGYTQDRLDRAQFAAKVTADAAASDAVAEIQLQKQMLATMAPAHVQDDMVALVASEEYRRGEPANMTHDLTNVTVCFCKIRTNGEKEDAAVAYDDIMGMHERVERLLAKFPKAIKIKTVGQTLVVAGPLHAGATEEECVAAAQDIFGFAYDVVHGTHGRRGLALRAGVCTGSIMATVMGTDRIAYDIFGDTVNTASRCMSTTEEFTMQAAMTTKAVCGEEYDMPPGAITKVFMKGKGDVAVFRF
jgi:class 3 adenylate cyclase